jgi:hypothetical protein
MSDSGERSPFVWRSRRLLGKGRPKSEGIGRNVNFRLPDLGRSLDREHHDGTRLGRRAFMSSIIRCRRRDAAERPDNSAMNARENRV